MRFNLHLAYWSLLSVTCISSCFLFFVVAVENAKYVAASSVTAADLVDAAAAKATALPEATKAATAAAAAATITATSPNAATSTTHEEVLPNYKKVKKLSKDAEAKMHAQVQLPQGAAMPMAPLDGASGLPVEQSGSHAQEEFVSHGTFGEATQVNVDPNSRAPAFNKISETIVMPVAGEDTRDVISKVPEQQEKRSEERKSEHVIEHKETDDGVTQPDKLQTSVPSSKEDQSLPDITDIPTITVTELPLEVLEPARGNLDALIIDATKESASQEHENRTVEILENSNEAMQKDEQIIKINDSGGGHTVDDAQSKEIPSSSAEHIPAENATNSGSGDSGTPSSAPPGTLQEQQQNASNNDSGTNSGGGSTVNLTAEEVPIPVFSEWAQKQMEAAEKQQAKEQEVVNTSAQKKNNTNGGSKVAPLKMRTKNYASPDCGAKIIASNADASNTGAVLSSSKDEYMLSPCGNRIWFVVELCEAIQAQKIELANFELFSSSPKNFTVAVSNRFPTRDWSNVGRFIAEDKRNVQSFTLHPHLFGKFVRVDIHSHYSKEHFCPVSLFRVFGTSEFEAFETENQPNGDLDDFEDEFVQEQAHTKTIEPNLFKSASDAVLSIVKKAAEVLVKPTNSQNTSLTTPAQTQACRTPAFGPFNCADCNHSLVERINNVLSCEFQQLNALLHVPPLRRDLLSTQVCSKQYGIDAKPLSTDNCSNNNHLLRQPLIMNVKQSYFLNLLPTEYIGALCQLLAESSTSRHTQKSHNSTATEAAEGEHNASSELALNLTIEKKVKADEFKIVDSGDQKLLKSEPTYATSTESTETQSLETTETLFTTTEKSGFEDQQLQRPPLTETINEAKVVPEAPKEQKPDVNIFNVPIEEQQSAVTIEGTPDASADGNDEQSTFATPSTTTATEATPQQASTALPPPAKSEEDPGTWENFDNLLATTTTATPGTHAETPGVNLQQKIPNGPQSESIFMRLSNRIKALERNMSLSGQYLEELSRRYKKQVEELQLTLTQQMQTVRSLEEHNRRHSELEQLLAQRNAQLKEELDDLSLQVHACIVVIIFVGAFVFLMLMVSILFYRSMRRETKEVLALHASASKRKSASSAAAMQKKLNRRKSFEDFSDHQQTLNRSGEKQRRPSEEALLILKDVSNTAQELGFESVGDTALHKTATPRERKVSVFYGNTNNSNGAINGSNASASQHARTSSASKRKGEKHSWPNTEHTQHQARQHLEQLQTEHRSAAEGKVSDVSLRQRNCHVPSGSEENRKVGKSRKKSQNLKRQESAPSGYDYEPRLNSTAPADINIEYDESLLLDEEGLDNFLPTSDLAYNEFMPEGPSGYQVDGLTVANANVNVNANINGNGNSKTTKAETKKAGRLTSPGFFKSPFTKSLKIKSSSAGKSKHPHESTSWEWYRSKKSEAQQKQLNTSVSASSGFTRSSPSASLDSSSLSEIRFPTESTENSFRILEEAIMTSGESVATSTNTGTSASNGSAPSTSNGNGHTNNHNHNSGSSGASSSNRSTTSSTSAKKKNRSFNKIFRKVF